MKRRRFLSIALLAPLFGMFATPSDADAKKSNLATVLESYLRDDWREFLMVGVTTLILMMLVRIVTYRGIIADAKQRNHGWFEVLCVGCDLCLLAIGGIFVFARLLDKGMIGKHHEGIAFCLVVVLTLLLLAAVISSFSSRHVTKLVFSADALLAMHVPNALGIVTLFIVAALLRSA